MQRSDQSISSKLSWLGEQAQTQFLDRNLDNHRVTRTMRQQQQQQHPFSSSSSVPKLTSYQSLDFDQKHTLRFQVIVWSVGIPDVKTHSVTIVFRVTLFWNDPPSSNSNSNTHESNIISDTHESSSNNDGACEESYWVMDGRRKAVRKRKRGKSSSSVAESSPASSSNLHHGSTGTGGDEYEEETTETETIDVPPISIINADTFEIVGQPDITLLRKKSRLMRFSCMYRARLQQESMNVARFPHDSHDLVLRLGILAQRQPGATWDRRKWKLGLANESDTMGSVRVPFGLLVDHVAVPGFRISERGLEFEMAPIDYGSFYGNGNHTNHNHNHSNHIHRVALHANASSNSSSSSMAVLQHQDFCVKAKIRVKRNSAYYDRNIVPLLDILNLVSISILVGLDATNFFQRGLLCLNIAFLEVGLRTSLDARLPTVGYEIKMQKLLNKYFFSILYIVLESAALKFLVENHDWTVETTKRIDHALAFFLLLHQFYLRMIIYKDFSAPDDEFETHVAL